MEETSQGFEKIARISQRNRNEYVPSKDKDICWNITNTENIMDFFPFLSFLDHLENHRIVLACINYLSIYWLKNQIVCIFFSQQFFGPEITPGKGMPPSSNFNSQ